MGYYDKLRLIRELSDDDVELIDIGIIKWGIYLIKYTERGRLQ